MHDGPSRRSIESLKKEAKRWLAALEHHEVDALARYRAAVPNARPNPTLRDVQHALAVEQGFSGWTALQQQYITDGAAASETLEHYEIKAGALLDAYRLGTPEAMERHWRLTWHRRAWSGMRTYVQVGLGYQASDDIEISIDDARWLVAREHGFEDWPSLVRAVSTAADPKIFTKQPIAVLGVSDGTEKIVSVSRDWKEIVHELAELDVTGIDAHGQLTDVELRELRGMTQLTSLKLGGCAGITDEGLRYVAEMPNVQRLELNGTSITDRGIELLRSLKGLKHLSLSWTHASDEGVAALAGCEQLEHVDLGGTYCGDGAIRAFASKPKLRHFISGQKTSNAGIAAFHDYPVFKRWHGGAVEMGLTSYDTEPNRLMLRGSFTDAGVAQLNGLDGLFGLNLDDSALAITGHSLAPLVSLPNLGWLAFDAKDDAMQYIARMPKLKFLGCQDTTCSDKAWTELGASQSIEHIWGRRCYGLEREGFLALSRIPTLGHLSVSCRNVDDVGIASLPDFPSLRELMPMDIPDAGYRHIGRCEGLTSLVLMYCRDTSDAATEHLVGLRKLETYFASYTQITDRTPQLLSSIDSLERVTFDSCAALTNTGIASLARLPNLREVRVSGRRLTSDVTRLLPAGVSVHYSL